MKRLQVFVVCAVLLIPSAAMAQTSAGPVLSTPIAVTTILSLLLGLLTNIVQTGTLLGQWIPPKTWLPSFTIAATFLSGVVGYFAGLSPLVLNGASVFYAVDAGVLNLLVGAAPGLAIHAHLVIPLQIATAQGTLRLAAKEEQTK
jgi:hypothetical protein